MIRRVYRAVGLLKNKSHTEEGSLSRCPESWRKPQAWLLLAPELVVTGARQGHGAAAETEDEGNRFIADLPALPSGLQSVRFGPFTPLASFHAALGMMPGILMPGGEMRIPPPPAIQ